MLPESYVIPHLRICGKAAHLETLRTEDCIFSVVRNEDYILTVAGEWHPVSPTTVIPRYARFAGPGEATSTLAHALMTAVGNKD